MDRWYFHGNNSVTAASSYTAQTCWIDIQLFGALALFLVCLMLFRVDWFLWTCLLFLEPFLIIKLSTELSFCLQFSVRFPHAVDIRLA